MPLCPRPLRAPMLPPYASASRASRRFPTPVASSDTPAPIAQRRNPSAAPDRSRIERVAEAITDEIDAQNHQGNRRGRRHPLPWQVVEDHRARCLGDEVSPTGLRRPDAETQEAEAGFE